MDPFLVVEDDAVRVTAILVSHGPVFPAFAYRFDTPRGSVVLSGDTAPCANLIKLARDADVLVHEVFDDTPCPAGEGLPGEAGDEDEAWEAERRNHHLLSAHTPLSKVGRLAAEADAARLVLTHFIPGDDVLPDEHWVKGVGPDYPGEVVVGADLLELSL
jgi:ribonuclease BN (tRNA processing enzyme)